MTTDTQREAFRKYAVDNGLLYIGKDNLATCVQNLEKHQRDFNAGWQAALSQQPVGEEELHEIVKHILERNRFARAARVFGKAKNGVTTGDIATDDATEVTKAILARFNISDRGK